MSADGIHDWEADEASPVRDASRAPGLDARAENTGLGRVFGELASENAELYRRNAEQTKRIDHLEAQLKLKDDRFEAWAREMTWREETMKSRIEQLERNAAERSGPAAPEHRTGKTKAFEGERTSQQRRGGRPSNETITVGTAVAVEVFTAVGDRFGASTAEAGGLAAGALGIFAALIVWARKRKEERDADRSQGRRSDS